MSPWLQTRSGQAYDLLHPDPTSIVLADVAFALAHINRYTGHAGDYSVAQHCVLGAQVLRDEGHDIGVQRAFLLHDAHEAVTGDVASPIKRALAEIMGDILGDDPGYVEQPWAILEERHRLAFCSRFGTPREVPRAVEDMDLRMLVTEAAQLMAPPPKPWGIPAQPIEGLRISRWGAAWSQEMFLREADRLGVV